MTCTGFGQGFHCYVCGDDYRHMLPFRQHFREDGPCKMDDRTATVSCVACRTEIVGVPALVKHYGRSVHDYEYKRMVRRALPPALEQPIPSASTNHRSSTTPSTSATSNSHPPPRAHSTDSRPSTSTATGPPKAKKVASSGQDGLPTRYHRVNSSPSEDSDDSTVSTSRKSSSNARTQPASKGDNATNKTAKRDERTSTIQSVPGSPRLPVRTVQALVHPIPTTTATTVSAPPRSTTPDPTNRSLDTLASVAAEKTPMASEAPKELPITAAPENSRPVSRNNSPRRHPSPAGRSTPAPCVRLVNNPPATSGTTLIDFYRQQMDSTVRFADSLAVQLEASTQAHEADAASILDLKNQVAALEEELRRERERPVETAPPPTVTEPGFNRAEFNAICTAFIALYDRSSRREEGLHLLRAEYDGIANALKRARHQVRQLDGVALTGPAADTYNTQPLEWTAYQEDAGRWNGMLFGRLRAHLGARAAAEAQEHQPPPQLTVELPAMLDTLSFPDPNGLLSPEALDAIQAGGKYLKESDSA